MIYVGCLQRLRTIETLLTCGVLGVFGLYRTETLQTAYANHLRSQMDSMSQSENYSKIRPMTQEERNRSKVREETNRFSFGMQIDGGMLYDAAYPFLKLSHAS